MKETTEDFSRLPDMALRARLAHCAFALDRAMKRGARREDDQVPGGGMAARMRTILRLLKERGVPAGRGDIRFARQVLAIHSRFLRTRRYPFAAPSGPMPSAEARAVEKAIRERRSVRFWEKRPVPMRLIRKLIEAGLWGPTGCNQQPVRFAIVRKPEMLQKVREIARHPQVAEAPAILFVALDLSVLEHVRETALLDAGAAAQNMLLMAHALGLGACWMGQRSFQSDALHRLLNLPPDVKINSGIVLGYPLEAPLTPGRIAVQDALLRRF